MPIDVVMPRLSDTMEEGTITRWLKQPGDAIHKGDAIAEVETDKANMEVEAFDEGTLGDILVKEGESIAVGQPIARLNGASETKQGSAETPEQPEKNVKLEKSDADEKTEGVPSAEPSKATDKVQKAEPPKRTDAPEQPQAKAEPQAAESGKQRVEPSQATGKPTRELTELAESSEQPTTQSDAPLSPSERRKQRDAEGEHARQAPEKTSSKERIAASPRARKLAEDQGVDLAQLHGSGPEGRIVEADVKDFLEKTPAEKKPQTTGAAQKAPSGMRQTIARRMTESKQTIPHFYVTSMVRADALVRLRGELQRKFDLSYNDLIIKACALALRSHTRLNAHWREDDLQPASDINVAFAVALRDGLITPVVHHADQCALQEIAEQTRELASRSRQNDLPSGSLSEATFTVSNMGMTGVESFSAIINPPQVAILAVGAICEVPVVENGSVIPGHELRLTLSADHRAINGMEAAEFLETLQHLLENPVLLSEAAFVSELPSRTHQ